MYQRSELDYLIYNDPIGYADLILNGNPETYLKTVTEYKSFLEPPALPVVFFIQQGGSSLRRSRLKIFLLYFAPQFSVYTKFRTDPFATGG